MKKKLISIGMVIVMLLSSQLAQVFASNEHSTTYKFAILIDGSDYIKSEDEMFTIHGSKSYGDIQNTGYFGNDTVYAEGPCTIECVGGEITIYKVLNKASISECLDKDYNIINFYDEMYISNVWSDTVSTQFLDNGTYILEMSSGGMGTVCRLIVGDGISNLDNYTQNVSLSYEAAVAYKSVIEKYIDTYGTFKLTTYTGAGTGVGLARLIDFDNNGESELLIGYCDGKTDVFFEVYSYSNSMVNKLAKVSCSSPYELKADMSIGVINDKTYIATSQYGAFDSHLYIGTVKNNLWNTDTIYTGPEILGDYMGEYVHKKNDIQITSDKYNEICHDVSKFENVDFNSRETTSILSLINYFIVKNQVSVVLNGKKIIFDQPPIIVDGRTLVPLRAIFEELGATVNWDGNTQTVTSTKGQTTISMSIGKTEMYKNGKLITLDVVPQLVGGRTLVPVRAVAEGFDCKVDWDGDNQTVIIKTIDTEKVINIAKNLYQANEDMGGVTNLATYAEVDALLYNSLNEIDKTLAVNEFTLDMVSAGTTATIAAAKVSTGNYSSIDNIGDGLSKLLSSKEIADAADGVLKDAIKQRVFNEISSSVPDANAFILNLGRSAYDRNSKMIQEFIVLHSKFKSGNYTYDDAVAYIVMHDTLVINRKTMSMAVEVLSDELPQNFLESLLMSAEASAKAVLGGLFGDAFSGRNMNVGAELYTDIITAYTDYACGEGVDFFKYMKQINHPAINEWVNEVEVYNSNLAQKLNINS